MTDELKPCKICGKHPEKYETRSHVIIECQSGEESDPGDYHRLFIARSSEIEAIKAWNILNILNESGELPEWLKEMIRKEIFLLKLAMHGVSTDLADKTTIAINRLKWVLSLKKPEEK